jgi:polyisoprenoid-binding protein YceI
MTVQGQLTRAEGKAEVGSDGAIAVTLSLDAASLDTKQKQRDKHLRSKDFFDVANHPTVTFTSTRVTTQGAGRLDVAGDLSIAGRSQPIAFEAHLSEPSGTTATVDAEIVVDRSAFGMTWGPLGMTASTVLLVVQAQFTKP